MPSDRSLVEREMKRLELRPFTLEGFNRRRERRQRNRRIRAGAVGVIVALVTGIILARSVTSHRIPAKPPVQPRPAPAAAGTLAYTLDGDIYVADTDGSDAVKIADGRSAKDCYGWGGEYWAEGPMWSPDGRYLAYRRFTDCSASKNPRDVVISDADGNVVATFPTGTGWDIGWSPDSTRVAVWDTFGETIGVYGLDGTRQTQLTIPPGWGPQCDCDPVWMPDGTSLRFDNVEWPLDGGTPRRLPRGSDASDTSHAPNGMDAFVDHRSLMVARSDGSGAVTLLIVERGTDIGVIGFSPQGDRILFTRKKDHGRGKSSLWSISVDGSDARLVVAGASDGEWRSR